MISDTQNKMVKGGGPAKRGPIVSPAIQKATITPGVKNVPKQQR